MVLISAHRCGAGDALAQDGAAGENGLRALELFAAEPFDGALIDLLMPGVDGLKVCKTIRETSAAAGRDFPVWIVTGARTHEAVAVATQYGVRAFVAKPFDWLEFRAMLEREFSHPAVVPPAAAPAPASDTPNEPGA